MWPTIVGLVVNGADEVIFQPLASGVRQADTRLLAACWARLTLARISVADLVQM